MAIPLYVAETWTITQKDWRKLISYEMWDILGTTRWDQIRDEYILCSTNVMPIEDQLKHLRLWWLDM